MASSHCLFICPLCANVWHIRQSSIKFSGVSSPPLPRVFIWCMSVCPIFLQNSHLPRLFFHCFRVFYPCFLGESHPFVVNHLTCPHSLFRVPSNNLRLSFKTFILSWLALYTASATSRSKRKFATSSSP